MAMWVKIGQSDSCSVERTASLAGLLYADKSGNREVILDKFISATSNVVLKFGHVNIMEKLAECTVDNTPISVSPEVSSICLPLIMDSPYLFLTKIIGSLITTSM